MSYGQLMNKDLSEFTMLITAEWIAANREAMAIQGVSELSQLDKNLLSAVRMRRSSETDPNKIRQMLGQNKEILQSGSIQATAVGAESFDLRKSEALRHIDELLAQI